MHSLPNYQEQKLNENWATSLDRNLAAPQAPPLSSRSKLALTESQTDQRPASCRDLLGITVLDRRGTCGGKISTQGSRSCS